MELLIRRERRDFRAMQKSPGKIERGLCLLTLIQVILPCPLFFTILLETVIRNSLTRNSFTNSPQTGHAAYLLRAWDATQVAQPLGTWAWSVSSVRETVGR